MVDKRIMEMIEDGYPYKVKFADEVATLYGRADYPDGSYDAIYRYEDGMECTIPFSRVRLSGEIVQYGPDDGFDR